MKKPSYAALTREVKDLKICIDAAQAANEHLSNSAVQAERDKHAAVKEAQEKSNTLAGLEAQLSVAHHLLDALGAPREAHGVKLDLVQRIAAIR